ncbi:MAG TPA: CdaR family protein, partial [Candidatus Binatia bacterium]|nr:CdaR family protein [Candidatus Binatia bacterium]
WEKVVSLAGSNFGLKALALIIALGLWAAGHRDTERALEVPLEFRNIPADLMVMENRVDYVVLRVMGPRTSVSTLDADNLKLSLDLDGAKSGLLSYPLTANDFNVPRGVTVARITPPVIHLRLEPVAKRTLPVSVRITGKPLAGYRVVKVTVRPESVAVQGPAEEVRRMAAVETVPVDVEEARNGIKRRVRLSNDGKPLSMVPDQVEVLVSIEEEQASRAFEGVDVEARDFKGVYNVVPPSVYVRVVGPKSAVEKLNLTSNEVYLNLKGLPAGEHQVPLEWSLPPDIQVVEQKPQRVRVRIVKPAE